LEIFIYSVFKHPDHKSDENKETKACDPKVPSQRLQENPSIFVSAVFDWNDHGDATFRVRQCKIDVLGPVGYDSCISDHSVVTLFTVMRYL